MRFAFSTAGKILFGPGVAREIAENAAALGTRACVVVGADPNRAAPIIADLKRVGLDPVALSIRGEPTVDMAAQAADVAREDCDLVVGVGGGGVLDAAKAVAALLTNHDPVRAYLEVVGEGRPLSFAPAPHIAVPTTAGTGAEATANSVLLDTAHRVKVSMRSSKMLPTLAVVDPELTLSMPPDITAASGLDALTQLLEAFVSKNANPMTSALCREGIVRAARSLRAAYYDGNNLAARRDMSLAALFSGVALANAKLGAAHGFAAPLGGMFKAPHGAVCAALLPHVMAVNVRALAERDPDSPSLAAYDEAARLLIGDPAATAAQGVRAVQSLCADLAAPPLSDYGVTEKDFSEIIAKAVRSGSMRGNPVALNEEDRKSVV